MGAGMSRKDSKGMFANLLGQADADTQNPAAPLKSSSPHLLKVAAGVRQLQERGDLAERLFKDGEQIVELDADAILPSTIPDRFEDAYEALSLDDLVQSMRERGQIVPGLVRPLDGRHGQFQIVYGRRRLAAARILGLKFRANVRELSDEQAVIFQGEENTSRNDLSFIEKCSFALAQEQAGYRRDVIGASLTTGKSHLSEMIRIAATVPHRILVRIGAAPEIGRRRWVEFADAWAAHTHAEETADQILSQPQVKAATSQERFFATQGALTAKDQPEINETALPTEIVSKGITLATVNYAKSGVKLNFNRAVPPDFIAFLTQRIESLHDDYVAQVRNSTNT